MAKHFHHLHALTAALLVYLAQSKRLLADRPGGMYSEMLLDSVHAHELALRRGDGGGGDGRLGALPRNRSICDIFALLTTHQS